MPNTAEWGALLQDALDKQLEQQATSGWMEDNAGQVQYEGGKEVKVPILSLQGLGDYGRDALGYPEGAVDVKYQTFTMRMDRGREFGFDRHDVDETNYVMNASQVMSEFQRAFVIPEIDAYRYSAIAQAVIGSGNYSVYTPDRADILSKLKADLAEVMDITGVDESQLIITINQKHLVELDMSDELNLTWMDFAKVGLNAKVRSLGLTPIIPVPSHRMKSAFDFLDGRSAGQEGGGFKPSADAADIGWIICPKTSPLAISKTDQVKIFSPDVNQDKDSWKTQYRKYHDPWIFENKAPGFRASFSADPE